MNTDSDDEMEALAQEALDSCGRLLMKRVRDDTIEGALSILHGKSKAPAHIELHSRLAAAVSVHDPAMEEFVTEIVDHALHALLFMFEDSELKLGFATRRFTVSDMSQLSDGLAGELYTEDGWIARFSKHPQRDL